MYMFVRFLLLFENRLTCHMLRRATTLHGRGRLRWLDAMLLAAPIQRRDAGLATQLQGAHVSVAVASEVLGRRHEPKSEQRRQQVTSLHFYRPNQLRPVSLNKCIYSLAIILLEIKYVSNKVNLWTLQLDTHSTIKFNHISPNIVRIPIFDKTNG